MTEEGEGNVFRILKRRKTRLSQEYYAQPICFMFMATERHSQFCTDSGSNEALMSPSFKKRKKKEHLIKKSIPKKD